MSKQVEKNQKALLTIRRKLLKLKQSPIYKEIKELERLDAKQAKIVKETMEHWSEQNQCWGENPSVSYYCGNCENEIELD